MPYSEWTRYLLEFSPDCASRLPPDDLYRAKARAPEVASWDAISTSEIHAFHEDGVIVVHNAFEAERVDEMIAAIEGLLRGEVESYMPQQWGKKHGVLLRNGLDFTNIKKEGLDALILARALTPHDARLNAAAEDKRLVGFLEAVMDDKPVRIHDMVRAKPNSTGDKPWHQDLTHFNVHPSARVVTAWIALDDAPEGAGCLYFLPGSHRRGAARHVFDRDYQIPDKDVARTGQVSAPVARGGCVLFYSLVHHGSPPNILAQRRLALQLTYKPSKAFIISDEERILAFSGTADRKECPN